MISPAARPHRSVHINVRLSPAEREAIERAAERAERHVSEYVRMVVLREARAVVASEADAQAA